MRTNALVFAIAISGAISAQDLFTVRIDAGIGMLSIQERANPVDAELSPYVGQGLAFGEQGPFLPTYGLKAEVGIKEKLAIGFGANYWQCSRDINYVLTDVTVDRYDERFLTFMPFANYYWLKRRESFSLYSGAHIGVSTFNSTSDGGSAVSKSKTLLAYQLNAIGMRFGKGLGAFVELGYGYHGIVNAGASVVF
ncbi:MAG: hypothetical protein WAU70_10080 [Flavobacteriales bacterium]